jgi:hypothetical protein
VSVDEIPKAKLRRIVRRAGAGHGPDTATELSNLLRSIFALAVRRGWRMKNPAKKLAGASASTSPPDAIGAATATEAAQRLGVDPKAIPTLARFGLLSNLPDGRVTAGAVSSLEALCRAWSSSHAVEPMSPGEPSPAGPTDQFASSSDDATGAPAIVPEDSAARWPSDPRLTFKFVS